jgi:hypothetical protein
MKILIIILFTICNVAFAQQPLSITTNKTTSLIFPFPIKHVDRGTKDVLVQPVKENEKILLVKAGAKGFSETNLSVVTADGNVYSFTVNYNDKPSGFVYELPVNSKASISTYANSILDNRPTVDGIKSKSWEMHASIIGIYIKDNVIYYQLLLRNHSPIDYDVDVLRFYIEDRKKGKRTAVQENDCEPLFVAGNNKQIKAFNFSVVVVALEKFIIPDAKFLRIQITEKNGGRHLHLKVTNSKIIKAVVLPDLH